MAKAIDVKFCAHVDYYQMLVVRWQTTHTSLKWPWSGSRGLFL